MISIQLDPATVWLHEESPGNRAFFLIPTIHVSSSMMMLVFSQPTWWQWALQFDHITCFIYSSKNVCCFSWAINIWAPHTAGPVHCFKQSPIYQCQDNTSIYVTPYQWEDGVSGSESDRCFDVTEATANFHYISSTIQRKWGQEYILVTYDGLKLDDSSGTQGMLSW